MCIASLRWLFSRRFPPSRVLFHMWRGNGMFGPTGLLAAKQFIIGLQPFKPRPSGLHSQPAPDYQSPYRRSVDPSDPSRSSPLRHTIFKRCTYCGRARAVPLDQKHHFHRCCGHDDMSLIGTLADARERPEKARRATRQWDFDRNEPLSKSHMGRPKGRSNFRRK